MDDNIRVYPSYPCRSVFSSGASDRLTRRRGEKERRSCKVCASRATARHAVPQHPSPETGASCNAADPDYSRQNSSTSSVLIRRIRVDPWFIPPGDNIRADPCSIPRTRYQAGCVPSPVTGIRTPKLPLRPVWEKGVGGMRGKGRRRPPAAPPRNGCVTLVA
jgi:hypothetical protein